MMMSYTLYLQQTPTVGTKVPFPSLAKGNYPLNEVIINAFLNLMQLTGNLDTDTLLDDKMFDKIWLKAEMTPARMEEIGDYIYHHIPTHPAPLEEEITLFKQAMQEEEALLAKESEKEGCIPIYKFATNDGWIVTPKECEIIASALTAKLLEDNHVFVEQVAKMSHIAYRSLEIALIDFGKFNQFAKKYGGYRVY
ncbi:hypothetical protein PPO22_16130 [Proteus mirabilis]|uniref:hypothetical protein n=2 Tax=Proteus mirabilis TaxID=584 RepID=UPI001A32EB4E|nr:hypothetical protein [Proteus mirabilis]MBI6251872.1 hypothetical protein [Proteus mirabilis]MBI6289744.1 hypothetical protein [Proteus mirabilis]MDC5889075.1 hypothetical protein [Proteus mirabilis]MDC5896156.1 hypothetical protein [Proteus mirabilis]MDC5906672.1 hypothetical protein [Proteus mirabilis]